MESLDEHEEAEHDREGRVKFIAEDSEGEEGFCNEVPCPVVEPLMRRRQIHPGRRTLWRAPRPQLRAEGRRR